MITIYLKLKKKIKLMHLEKYWKMLVNNQILKSHSLVAVLWADLHFTGLKNKKRNSNEFQKFRNNFFFFINFKKHSRTGIWTSYGKQCWKLAILIISIFFIKWIYQWKISIHFFFLLNLEFCLIPSAIFKLLLGKKILKMVAKWR